MRKNYGTRALKKHGTRSAATPTKTYQSGGAARHTAYLRKRESRSASLTQQGFLKNSTRARYIFTGASPTWSQPSIWEKKRLQSAEPAKPAIQPRYPKRILKYFR